MGLESRAQRLQRLLAEDGIEASIEECWRLLFLDVLSRSSDHEKLSRNFKQVLDKVLP